MSNARSIWNGSALVALVVFSLFSLILYSGEARAFVAFPPFGGVGDHDVTDNCPSGQILVGLSLRSGAWVDQIALTCAPVDPATGATGLAKDVLPARGGTGGGPSSGTCLPGFVIHGVGLMMTGGERQIRSFVFECVSTTSTARHSLDLGNSSPYFPSIFEMCPTGEAVVGARIRYGKHVNAIGLVCDTFDQIEVKTGDPQEVVDCPDGGDEVPAEWSGMLKAHNDRRAQHCVQKLKWCSSIAKSAQTYASKCIVGAHDPNIAPDTGENIANAYYIDGSGNPVLPALSDEDAFDQTWYCEIDNYDFNNPVFVGGFTRNCERVNGHFTQVVWKDTEYLGCGRATCEINGHQGTQWVCRYKLRGNVNVDNPFVLSQQVKRRVEPGQECQ